MGNFTAAQNQAGEGTEGLITNLKAKKKCILQYGFGSTYTDSTL